MVTNIVKDLGSISVDIAPYFSLLEDGSSQVHLPFPIPLFEQVVDELVLPLARSGGHLVEHVLDVFGQVIFCLEKQHADMLLHRPALGAKLLGPFSPRRICCCFWVGHFQSTMIVDGAKLLMKTILSKDNVPEHA